MPLSANGDPPLGFISSNTNEQMPGQGTSPEETEAEREALEETLGDLVVRAFHRLLYPGSALLLAAVPNSDRINDALSVSQP